MAVDETKNLNPEKNLFLIAGVSDLVEKDEFALLRNRKRMNF